MLRDEMHNGASVSDWMGTAALAARSASRLLEVARADESRLTETLLREAADEAAQALDEITAVMNHYGYQHGYTGATFGTTV